MKRLISVVMFSFMLFPLTNAQIKKDIEVSPADFEHMVESRLELNLRNYMINSLELSKEEIMAFDPVFREYMRDKSEISDKKYNLLDEYAEEMKEDDSARDEREETADMIEDYWEYVIDEMELRKKYFDRFEDILPLEKATEFFLLEEMLDRQLTYQNLIEIYPVFIEIETASTDRDRSNTQKDTAQHASNWKHKKQEQSSAKANIQYKDDIEAFNQWVMKSEGKVDLDHEYTHDGLTKLVAAITAISKAENVKITDFSKKKAQIMKLADEMRKNRYSDEHADMAREAFILSANLLNAIQQENNFSNCSPAVSAVSKAAQQIDPAKLMTPQADAIYNFFDKARKAVNSMSGEITWVDHTQSTQSESK